MIKYILAFCALASSAFAVGPIGGGGTGAATGSANTFSALQTFGADAKITSTGLSGSKPLLFTFGGSYPGSSQARNGIIFKTNDGSLGDYSIDLQQYPTLGNAGGTIGDNTFWIGYNNSAAPNHVIADHTFGLVIESSYYSGVGQTQGEMYVVADAKRPFGITPNWDDASITANFAVDTLNFGLDSATNSITMALSKPAGVPTEQMSFNASTKGSLDFAQYRYGESSVTKDFVTRAGATNLFGLSSTNIGRLFAGVSSVSVGSDLSDGTTDITLYVGNPDTPYFSAMRYNHTTAHLELIDHSGATPSRPVLGDSNAKINPSTQIATGSAGITLTSASSSDIALSPGSSGVSVIGASAKLNALPFPSALETISDGGSVTAFTLYDTAAFGINEGPVVSHMAKYNASNYARFGAAVGGKENATSGDFKGNYRILVNTGSATSTVAAALTVNSDKSTTFATFVKLTPGSAPGTPAEGQVYADSGDHHLSFYNGTAWKQLDN